MLSLYTLDHIYFHCILWHIFISHFTKYRSQFASLDLNLALLAAQKIKSDILPVPIAQVWQLIKHNCLSQKVLTLYRIAIFETKQINPGFINRFDGCI